MNLSRGDSHCVICLLFTSIYLLLVGQLQSELLRKQLGVPIPPKELVLHWEDISGPPPHLWPWQWAGCKARGQAVPLFTGLLTDLSRTVGMKSCPMPSTSMVVVLVLFISLGRATMEPSGSTPMICEGKAFCQTKTGIQNQPNTKLKGKVTHTLISSVSFP